MAYDRAIDSEKLRGELGDIADEIREKGGTQAALSFPQGFIQGIDALKTYSANDNGKVVVNGELESQSSLTVTENDTYDTTNKNQVVVNVAGSGDWDEEFAKCLEGQNSNYPPGITEIRTHAFYKSGVTAIDLSDNDIVTIGTYAFCDCASLQTIDLSDNASLVSIGEGALQLSPVKTLDLSGCTALQTLADNLAATNSNRSCSLTGLDLSDCVSLKTIGYYAFKGSAMTSLLFPDATLTYIGANAFRGQANIRGPLVVDCAEFGDNCFIDCTGLTKVTVKNCNKYGIATFSRCTGITEAYITKKPTGSWPSTITTYPVFWNCSNVTDIYVPWSQGEIAENKFFLAAQNPTWHYDTVF